MQARIIRWIPLDEVKNKVADLERKYGGSLEGLSYRLPDGQVDGGRFEDYVDWLGMMHSLRAYGEGEDFDYYTEETVELDLDAVSKLTPRRIELLNRLSRLQPRSINDLALKIGRDVKNVYCDLKVLEQLGFIGLRSQGRRILPRLLVQEITLLVA